MVPVDETIHYRWDEPAMTLTFRVGLYEFEIHHPLLAFPVRLAWVAGLSPRKVPACTHDVPRRDTLRARRGGMRLMVAEVPSVVDLAIAQGWLRRTENGNVVLVLTDPTVVVDAAILVEPDAWSAYLAGNDKAAGRIIGRIMQTSSGADARACLREMEARR